MMRLVVQLAIGEYFFLFRFYERAILRDRIPRDHDEMREGEREAGEGD